MLDHRARLVAESVLSELNRVPEGLNEDGSSRCHRECGGKSLASDQGLSVVDAAPEQVAAVFFDFESAKSFVPNVIKSEISNRISPCTWKWITGSTCQFFPMNSTQSATTCDWSMRIRIVFDWKLLRAVMTKDSVGNFRVEPWEGKAAHLLPEHGHAELKHSGIVAVRAIEQMKETTKALASKVEKEKSANPPGLKRQVAALRAALRQPPAAELTKY